MTEEAPASPVSPPSLSEIRHAHARERQAHALARLADAAEVQASAVTVQTGCLLVCLVIAGILLIKGSAK
jgi:hypothetical protein